MDAIASSDGGLTVEAYAARKGLTVERLMRWGVVTARNPYSAAVAVALPYYDLERRLVRTKYRTPAGTVWDRQQGVKPVLYGLWILAKAPADTPVILVEGESDCHACWHHSILALGLPGCSVWSPTWADLLQGREVFVWREPDGGGGRMIARVAPDLPTARVVHPSQDKDLADLRLRVAGAFDTDVHALLKASVPIADVLESLPVDPAPSRPVPSPSVGRWNTDYRPRGRTLLDDLTTEHARGVPITTIMERMGFEPRRRGHEWVVCCPFHEDQRPSLRMSTAKNTWFCDPCGQGGDSLDFVMRVRGLSFPDAVREVAGW